MSIFESVAVSVYVCIHVCSKHRPSPRVGEVCAARLRGATWYGCVLLLCYFIVCVFFLGGGAFQ